MGCGYLECLDYPALNAPGYFQASFGRSHIPILMVSVQRNLRGRL